MRFILTLSLLFISFTAQALEVPVLRSPVMDQAGVLSKDKKNALETDIRHIWEQEKQVQISVLIIQSLEGESIEDYSMKVAEKWQLGTKNEDNGLLILIAMQDRKMRIEVGNGIEGVITDSKSGRMIRDMGSFMRDKDVYGALNNTISEVHNLMKANTPEALAERAASEKYEAERIAEQNRIESEQRAEKMEALAQMAVWVLVGFLFLLSGYNLYDNYFSIPKEIKALTEEKEQLTGRLAKEKAELTEKAKEVQGMKIDRTNQTYVRNKGSYQDLVGRKSQLSASIKTMKNYLGVK